MKSARIHKPPGGQDTVRSVSSHTTDRTRRLGLWSAGALVVANMIGAGVFTTSGFALADLGRPEPVLLAWLVGGIVAMLGALSYGALARRLPESGGEYLFLSRVFHPLAGFLAGWVSLWAGFSAPIAVAALGLQAYLASALPIGTRPEWLGAAAILAAGAIHGLRLREGVWLQNSAVALKLSAIVAFVILGALRLPDLGSLAGETQAGANVGLSAFAVTLVWISFSYSGWNAATYVAGEIRNPERNLFRALWMATGCVTLAYLTLNAIFVFAAPVAELAGRADIGAAAAEALGGPPFARAVSVLVALALFTSISSMVMAGSRVYAQMASDGLFPKQFVFRGDAPTAAVALQVGLVILLVWFSGLLTLFGYIGFTLGISSAATVTALLVLRRREGAERVPIPGYPWVPGIFITVTLLAAVFMALREPGQAGAGLLTLLLGLAVYGWMRRRRNTNEWDAGRRVPSRED